MKYNYQFSNLSGVVYKKGNLIFLENGDCLLSPVGNRLSRFDLKRNESSTFPFENRKDIYRYALSPNEQLLVLVDKEGRSLLVNLPRQVVLHHFNFKCKVNDIKFSPNGKFIAVTHDKCVHVWRTPGTHREFAPFELYRKFPAQYDSAKCIDWSDDSSFFVVGNRDMSCRVYSLHLIKGFRYVNLTAHRSAVINCFFNHQSLDFYSVSKDGAVVVWKASLSLEQLNDHIRASTTKPQSTDNDTMDVCGNPTEGEELGSDEEEGLGDKKWVESDNNEEETGESATKDLNGLGQLSVKRSKPTNIVHWTKAVKYLYSQNRARVSCAALHKPSGLLATGFTNGVFTLHEMPDFTPIHTLSISEHSISSVAINKTGDWLAFGSSALGQLLVWEWQSETYILKQQGHCYDMNTLCYSPDGRLTATGGDDGKVKLWDNSSGFCFVTFPDHTSSVTAIVFAQSGKVVLSSSLDGTVRAYDLNRYRNFRTFVSPRPAQFTCLSLDPSGEIVTAGSHDTFEVFVWSMQTGRLLEILSGHEGPVSGVAFSPSKSVLASCSWDNSVKIWDVFESKGNIETMKFSTMAICLTYRPDGEQLCVATLDGNLTFWDAKSSVQTGCIEGRRDLEIGRRLEDKVTAKTLSGAAHFTTVCYSADGRCVLAGGRSKFICLYDVEHQVLINRFQTSSNEGLDGIKRMLSHKGLTEAGPLDLISDDEVASDDDDRGGGTKGISLPGFKKGDYSSRKTRPEIRTKCLQFSPTGRAWSAITTEGLLTFTLDKKISFDPFDLSHDVTPDSVKEAIKAGTHTKAISLSLRLNEYPLILEALEAVPINAVQLVLRELSDAYIERLIPVLADRIIHSPHLQYYLHWCSTLLLRHTQTLKGKGLDTKSFITDLQKSVIQRQTEIGKLCDSNTYGLQYALSAGSITKYSTSGDHRVDCTITEEDALDCT